MDNTINEMFAKSVLTANRETQEIKAYFKNGHSAVYTMETLPLLKTDPSVATIIDNETGEILY